MYDISTVSSLSIYDDVIGYTRTVGERTQLFIWSWKTGNLIVVRAISSPMSPARTDRAAA
jgi:hypothetical protein